MPDTAASIQIVPTKKPPEADGVVDFRTAQAGAAAGALLRRALAAILFRFRYASRRFRLITLLSCLPIRFFTSLRGFDSVGVTMIVRHGWFNIYLLCLAPLALAIGCRSPESRREQQVATLRVHLEVGRNMAGFSEEAPIFRANPITVNVTKDPILTESSLAAAKVITDSLGGFALQIQFDAHGTLVLEQYTATNPGKRLVIYADFGEKLTEHRWLGAPVVPRRIANGVLTFTPDATREEAEQIALGWNNTAIKSGNQEKPKKKAKTE